MFFFLSKLLPLLVYPLGFSCVLIAGTIALVTLGRQRAAIASASLALVILLVSSNSWVAIHLMASLEWQHLPPNPMPTADAIVVLGGGTRSAHFPRPWVDLAEAGDRIIHGIRLYQQGRAPLLILSGGRVSWLGGGSAEAEDMAAIATAFGVPRSAILQDNGSLNTYQNAVNVQAIAAQRQVQTLLLVTSASHMPRALAIFRRLGLEAIPAPTDFWVTVQEQVEIRDSHEGFVISLLPNAENLHQVSRALKEYLGLWVYRLRGWA